MGAVPILYYEPPPKVLGGYTRRPRYRKRQVGKRSSRRSYPFVCATAGVDRVQSMQ